MIIFLSGYRHAEVNAKYSEDLARESLEWIASITQDDINTAGDMDNFYDVLRDGTLLCKVFENEDDLLNHLKFRNHKFPEIRQTIGDVARMEFLKQKDVLTATSSTISTFNICPNEEDKNTFFRVYAKGFGRRKIKKSRFNEKQKDFVGNLFEEAKVQYNFGDRLNKYWKYSPTPEQNTKCLKYFSQRCWHLQKQSEDANIVGEKVLGNISNTCLKVRLVNTIKPGSVKKVNTSAMAFKCMENINAFLEAARDLGVPAQETFQTVDLWERQNLNSVVICLQSLGRKAGQFGKPSIGPKESEKNERMFSEEKLKAGQTIIGLQMGSNKGATQSGINFGNTRHM
ncbi:unnamed protein product [Brassicogethes aeneus]|uniref:Calponin-homology (CH) domain-containing protein n=1 Tax=Brassicogethes aeneus TaxID=1431903 RepID=A0A9P0AR63_BRAAE|nr:unnamed protein product [Brassicogethes aeneus]